MIRRERFTLDTDSFAAQRRQILEQSDDRLRDAVKTSLTRLGLNRWKDPVVNRALEVFDSAAAVEMSEAGPQYDDMRDEFERELRAALEKTKVSNNLGAQTETITRWLSTYAINAGTEAAVVSDDGDDELGLEWITMNDGEVRESHVTAGGQIVPVGEPFSVGGEELLYPGQPVGDPAIWINCRCVARPTMLEQGFTSDFKAKRQTSDAMVAAPVIEEEILEEDVEVEDGTTPPPIDQAESEVAVPWHALLAPEGVPTGDKRMFALNSLSNRDLPVPLKFMPADAEGHDGSYVVGRIDKIWKNETGEFWAEGVFDFSPQAYEAVRMIAEEMQTGISVDVDAVEGEINEDGEEEYTSARISGATQCAIPAFAESKIFLGPYQEIEADEVETEELPDSIAASVRRLTDTNLSPEFQAKFLQQYGHIAELRDTFVSEEKWDGSASRFTDEQWHKSCILHLHSGAPTSKSECKLPIREPSGALNRAGVHAAASRIGQVDAPPEAVAKAKASLRSAYKELGEEVPDNLTASADELELSETFDIPPRKTKDGPGWITEPKPTKRITAYWVDGPGAAKIGWGAPGDFNRCRLQLAKYVQNPDWLAGLCANLHYRALGAWPGQASGRTKEMSSIVAAGSKPLPSDWFKDPQLEGPTPFTVTPDGHVFGHIATWDTCHIGYADKCELPQPSATNYAYFLTGEVDTDAGPVAVGQVTMGGGHADLRAGIRAAAAHYDSTSAAVADIAVGDDAYGVWCNGALRPNLADEDVHALRASGALSGDWRGVRVGNTYSREMIAALAVNVPGFPIPRTKFARNSHETTALVAAGIVADHHVTDQSIDQRVEAVLARRERMASAEEARRKVRMFRAKQIKAGFKH